MSKNIIKQSDLPTPEYVDFKGLELIFGIRRSLGYELVKNGAIRSVSLGGRGKTRGKRLFDVKSVRSYIESQLEIQNPDKDETQSS